MDKITHPKANEWVLVVDGIKEAFDAGYAGKWTLKHHNLIGQLIKVHNVEQFPNAVITCYPTGKVTEYLEFPHQCIQKLAENIPDGWYPAELPPLVVDERYYLNHNVYIAIGTGGSLRLVFSKDNIWYSYFHGYTAREVIYITAYQLVPHYPIKKGSKQ